MENFQSRITKLEAENKRLADDNKRLREVIDAAPHDDGCYWIIGHESKMSESKHCNCWKSKALREGE